MLSQRYQKPFFISLALHVGILAFLFTELSITHSYRMPGPQGNTPVIQAVAVIKNSESVKEIQKAVEEAKEVPPQPVAQSKPDEQMQQHEKMALEAKHQAELEKKIALKKQVEMQKQAELKKQLELKKQAELKRKQTLALKQKQLQEKRQNLLKEQQALQQKLMQEQMNNEKQTLGKIQDQRMQGQVDEYKAKIVSAIGQQWLIPAGTNSSLKSLFLIHIAPGGTVLDVKLLQSSGNAALDQSAQVAILKASPLPVPTDSTLFDKFRELRLTVSPKQVVSWS